MELTPFFGLGQPIDLVLKVLSFLMKTEGMLHKVHSPTDNVLTNFRTNVLDRYFNKDFTLVLPEKKKITDIKWFAIYDIWSQNTFGDIYVPEEFEPPTMQKVSQLTGKTNQISTISVEILDAKQIKLIGFTYDGKAKDAYFWVGVGAQPVSKGFKVPDEYG